MGGINGYILRYKGHAIPMNLSKVTLEKIVAGGWITPEEISNAFSQLIQDFDIKLTRGTELRKDLIMTRLDNFRMELIRRCEKNIELEESRNAKSSRAGWFSGESGGKQDSGKRQESNSVSTGSESVGQGPAGMGSGDLLREDSGDSNGSNEWTKSSGLGRTRPL